VFETTKLQRTTGQEADPDYFAGLKILPGYVTVTDMTTPSTFKNAFISSLHVYTLKFN